MKDKPRHELIDLELDEISLVDSPANKRALVRVWKRAAPVREERQGLTGPQKFIEAIKKAFRVAAPEADATEVDAALDEAGEVLTSQEPEPVDDGTPVQKMAKAWAMMSEDEKAAWLAANPGKKPPVAKREEETPPVETVTKADFEAVQKRLEAAEAKNAANEAALAEVRKREEIGAIAKRLADAGVADAAEAAADLHALPVEKREAFEKRLTLAAAQAAEAAAVLTAQAGSGRVAKAGSAEADVEALAKARREKTGEPIEVAKGEVIKSLPVELRKRLNEEAE